MKSMRVSIGYFAIMKDSVSFEQLEQIDKDAKEGILKTDFMKQERAKEGSYEKQWHQAITIIADHC